MHTDTEKYASTEINKEATDLQQNPSTRVKLLIFKHLVASVVDGEKLEAVMLEMMFHSL